MYAQDPGALQALLNGMAGEVNLVNNEIKVPYSDQFSLGMRNRLGDWNTSVAVTRILSKDGFVFSLGNRYPNGDFWQNRSQPWGNSPPGLAGNLLIGNSGIETKSTQILLSAEKPFTEESHWGATVVVHVHGRRSESRHHRALRLRPGLDRRVSLHPVQRRAPNIASSARARTPGPWGLMLGGQAHLGDAAFRTM